MVRFLRNRMTYVVFALVILLSIFAIAAIGIVRKLDFWPVLVASLMFNLWSIYQSESGGFVKKKEYRRWKEPPRHFSSSQVVVIYGIVLIEALLCIFVVARKFF